jgi:hypothetical protein
MPVSKQHTKITRQVDTKHLEQLASQSVQDPRPTSKMHQDELLGLLGKAGDMAPKALPVQEVDDDGKTHRLETTPFRTLAAGSQQIKPPPFEPVEAPRNPDLAEPHAPVLPAARSKAGRIVLSLLLLTIVASVGFLGVQLAT